MIGIDASCFLVDYNARAGRRAFPFIVFVVVTKIESAESFLCSCDLL
jgi:hypothetical protein